MSGNDGIRGYYYQILATLLDSVEDESWENVIIEPVTNEDKVDIKWEYTNLIRVVQVKSSINNFTKSLIEDWIYKLVLDAQNSYKLIGLPINYTLFLIGTTDHSAETWISNLRNNKLNIDGSDKLKEIKSELNHINVKKQSFDMAGLEALAHTRMQRYIEHRGKSANFEVIETICNVIVSELFKLTMVQKSMSKGKFKALVDRHLKSGDYNITNNKGFSELTLSFYEQGKVEESNSIQGIHLQELPFQNQLKQTAKDNLIKAQAIKLLVPEQEEQQDNKQYNEIQTSKGFTIADSKDIDAIKHKLKSFNENKESLKALNKWVKENSLSELFPKGGYIPVRMPHEEIVQLKELSQSILGIELSDTDFFFGGLEERLDYTQRMFGGPVKIPRGTEDKKAKYYAIIKAHTSLLFYQELMEYSKKYLRTCYPLPLILKNTGAVADENIQVTLKFPSNVEVQTPERFQPPLEPIIKDFINDESNFDNIFLPTRVHTILEYQGLKRRKPFLQKTISYTRQDFINHMDCLFKYNSYTEGEQDIIQYEFRALNPACRMAFPSFLVVKTDIDMVIQYEITSKQLSEIYEGKLYWHHPDNLD